MKFEPDLSIGRFWKFPPMTEDCTLEFPVNLCQSEGQFYFVQDAFGGRELIISEEYTLQNGVLNIRGDALAETCIDYKCDGDKVHLVAAFRRKI